MQHSYAIPALLLLLSFPSPAPALAVLFGTGGGPVVIINDDALIATGDGADYTIDNEGTTVTGNFGAVPATYLDPLATSTSGTATLALAEGDPLAGSGLRVVMPSIPPEGDPGVVDLYFSDDTGETTFLHATCGELRNVQTVGGIVFTDFVHDYYVTDLHNVVLGANGSRHIENMIALNNGTSNPDVAFRLAVCFVTGRWAIVMAADDASFDSLQDRTYTGWLAETVSNSAYMSITSNAAVAKAYYLSANNPASSGATARSTLVGLKATMDSLVSTGAMPGSLRDTLKVDCNRVIHAIDWHANYPIAEILGAPLPH